MNHVEYRERLKGLPNQALRYIIMDAEEAVNAMPDGPNVGYYADEISYAGMELKNRQRTMHKWEASVGDQIATLNRVDTMLRMAGYTGQDTLDNLRDLIKSAERPATEEDAVEATAKLLRSQPRGEAARCGICGSTGFVKSDGGCEFCDGTEGGNAPEED